MAYHVDGDGGPVRVPIFDTHHHVGTPDHSLWTSAEWRAKDQAERLTYMDANQIDKVVVMPVPSMFRTHSNTEYGHANTMAATYRDELGDAALGMYATVNPADTGSAVAELDRAFTELGADGVSFHHRYLGMFVDDPRIAPLLEIAEHHSKVVAVHIISDSSEEAPWRLFALARRFPNVRFLGLDGFSSHVQSAYLREFAADFPNVWFDTGVASSTAHGLKEFIDDVSSDRLVIGTDRYSGPDVHFHHAFAVNEVGAMGLTAEQLWKVANRNLLELLGRSAVEA